MSKTVLSVKIKCQPGTRDDVRSLWETATKPHAEDNPAVLFSTYAYAHEDPDTIILFEVLRDASVLTSLYQEKWFKEYLLKMSAFLVEPPQIITGDPVWIKELR